MRRITTHGEAGPMVSDHTTNPTAVDFALALLTLPEPGPLAEAQVRGQNCVWCGITLVTETAVDLGPRRKTALDGSYDWFPRGCKTCTGPRALHALHDHAPRCEQCVDGPVRCETGRVLRRLALGRRP
ncbi:MULTISPECIES: hypothetical protein [unclassified Streptomyces]|uniref:hypothetical protein n=1 Tax=unclassified Streptomyces TaxID=2593676 RepID=UPI0036DFB83C